MTDTYGGTTLPDVAVTPPDAAGDPVLRVLVDFATAVLRANEAPPWQQVCRGKRVVETSYTHNPETGLFTDNSLPALYLFRNGGQPPEQDAAEWRRTHPTLTLRWVFPLQTQTVERLRDPIIASLTKALDRAFYLNRDPSYVRADDTDPTAPTFAETAATILLSSATSTSSQSFTGAGLTGPAAGQPINPPRGVIVDLTNPSSWIDGSQIVLSGNDVLGNAQSVPLTVSAARIPGRLYSPVSFTTLTGVSVAAQNDALGTLSVGTGARQGYGTNIVAYGFDLDLASDARWRPVRIPLKGSSDVRSYPAIEWSIHIVERLLLNPAEFPSAGAGIDQFGAPATGPGASVFMTNADGRTTAAGSFT